MHNSNLIAGINPKIIVYTLKYTLHEAKIQIVQPVENLKTFEIHQHFVGLHAYHKTHYHYEDRPTMKNIDAVPQICCFDEDLSNEP